MKTMIENRIKVLTEEKQQTMFDYQHEEEDSMRDILAERNMRINFELKFLNELSKANVSGQLPNNLIIYKQAKKLKYVVFCDWLNAKLGNLR